MKKLTEVVVTSRYVERICCCNIYLRESVECGRLAIHLKLDVFLLDPGSHAECSAEEQKQKTDPLLF